MTLLLQVAIQQLRERLGRALGQQQAPTPVTPAAKAQAQQHRTQPQPAAHIQPVARHPFVPVQPAMVPQPVAAAPAAPAASVSAQPPLYYQPVGPSAFTLFTHAGLLLFVCFSRSYATIIIIFLTYFKRKRGKSSARGARIYTALALRGSVNLGDRLGLLLQVTL